jgi:hypothetical protein
VKKRFFILLMLATRISFSQKSEGETYAMYWVGYYNTTQLHSKWSINTDIQHRTKNGYEIQAQSLIRSSLAYKINGSIQLSTGLAHFRHFITNQLNRGEWRPWQEVSATQEHDKLKFINKLRVEQRFNQTVYQDALTNNYVFNWRFRYRFEIEMDLFKQRTHMHSFNVGNEFMINAARSIGNPFDQNRSYVSYNYQLTDNIKLQLQYMYIIQYLASRTNYDHVSVIRFNLYHTINNEHSSNK